MDLLGQDELQLQVGDLQVQFPVFIARDLTQECLLGADFLKQHDCVINMREQTLVAGGKQVVCQPNQFPELMSVCHVSFSADTVIPGHCQMHIPVSHSQKERVSGVLEPAVSFMEQQGLIIARSVCSMEKGSSIIRVLNPSPAPVAVYSNQKVGILHPLSKAEGVCALKELDEGSRENRDSGTLEEAVKLMTSRAKDLSSEDIERLQSLLFEYGGVISLGDDNLGCTDVVKHRIDTIPIDTIPTTIGARPGGVTLDVVSGLFR